MQDEEYFPYTSIIMTVYNAEHTIAKCVDSLLNLEYPKEKYEIIIIDGYSKDRTFALLQDYSKRFKKPKIIVKRAKSTPPSGRNIALRYANGEFIAITDGDIVVNKNWLSVLLKHITKSERKRIGGVGGPNNSATKDTMSTAVSCIPLHGPTQDYIPFFNEKKYEKEYISNNDVYTTVCRNALYRKEVLEEINGFDERLFSVEDPELNLRILKKNYLLLYTPEAVALHFHRSTLSGFFKQQRNYSFWQAVANKLHPELFNIKQIAPFVAILSLLFLLLLALWKVLFLYILTIFVIGILIPILFYGFKCAYLKKNWKLSFVVPIIVLTLLLAWAIFYPTGMICRKKELKKSPGGIR